MRSNFFQKFFGWALLFIGVAIIFWSLHSSYNIFTAKVTAPEIFKAAQKEVALAPKGKVQGLEAQLEAKVQEMIGEQLKEILPAEAIPKLFNLIAWSIFAGILIFGGAQIAGLGIKLLK